MSRITAARRRVVTVLKTVDGLTVRDSLPDATPSEPLAVVMFGRAARSETPCDYDVEVHVLIAIPQTEPGVADAALEAYHDPVVDALEADTGVLWESTQRTVYRDATPCLDVTLTVRE